MSETAFVVAGTRRSLVEQSMSISHAENQQATLMARLFVTLGDWMPAVLEEIAVWTQDAPIQGARTFDGATSVLARGFTSGVTDNWSIGAWVYVTSTAAQGAILSIGDAADGYGLRYNTSGDFVGVLSSVTTVGGTSAPVPLNTWAHVALVRTSGSSQLYLNGVAVGSPVANAPAAPNGYISVGARRNAGDTAWAEFVAGQVAHAFLAHSALTAAQIAAIASGGPSNTGRGVDAVITGTYWYYPILGVDSPEPDTAASSSLTVTSAVANTTGPLVIASDADVKFGGEINEVVVSGRGGWSSTKLVVEIAASDFNSYPDRITQAAVTWISESVAARLSRVQANVPLFTGTTVAADQPTGPTLIAQPLSYALMRDLFATMEQESGGYVLRINAFKEMSMRLPSAVQAPFDIDTTADADGVDGDVIVRRTIGAGYVNFLRVLYGNGTRLVNDVFTGDGVLSSFTLSVDFDALANVTVFVNGTTTETLEVDRPGLGASWELDTSTKTLTRVAGALPNGHTVQIDYLGRYPAEATSYTDIPTNGGVYGDVLELPDTYELATANTRGSDYFDVVSVIPEQVTYATYVDGLRPGQEQDITVPQRGFDETCRITEVTMEMDGLRWRHTISAVVSGKMDTWRDTWQELAK